MDLKVLKRIIKIFKESGVNELEVESDGIRVRLKQQVEETFNPPPGPSPSQVKEKEEKGLIEITSPMIGTFYRAPAPDAPPFVNEGQEIDVGDVLCIIEAMKLMNEIKSEVKGRIVKILVENGQPVEYGQPLFIVEASK